VDSLIRVLLIAELPVAAPLRAASNPKRFIHERLKKILHFQRIVRDTVHMKTITYTAARENLATTMQRACEDHDPVVITRRRDQAVVMMSMEDYASLEETAYLLRSPKNARRLREAVDQLRSGSGSEHELPEL
jgi:antitoxin YefM